MSILTERCYICKRESSKLYICVLCDELFCRGCDSKRLSMVCKYCENHLEKTTQEKTNGKSKIIR